MPNLVVSNASPLIAFERIGRLDLPEQLFGTILIPPAVVTEVGPTVAGLTWLTQRPLVGQVSARITDARLGGGETEAIALAIELNANWVLLDDEPARRLARELGVPTIGTVGLLMAAKRREVIPSVRPILDALIAVDFRISRDLFAGTLDEAGEGTPSG